LASWPYDGVPLLEGYLRGSWPVMESLSPGAKSEPAAEMDVHLICDNLSTHKTPAITAWLDAHPRFHMHFTPTSSSWLNQVERWFGLLTDKQIRRGVHKNIQALERDIRAWITTWNDNPRPFAWTKTADEILERLASYIQRIPGAGH
jgi:DDE superfamily endonuclease